MVRDGAPLVASDFTEKRRIGGRWLDDIVAPEKVVGELDRGATLVLQSLHRHLPSVAEFCTALQEEISHLVQANAYLTPPEAAGLAEHADRHHVFVVQVAGRKEWNIEGVGDRVLETGDVLYMPAGVRHRAASAGEVSLHLTIGVIPTSYRDVIERALRTATESWDDPLPIGFASGRDEAVERFGTELGERLALLAETAIDLDAAGIVEREVRRRPAPRSAFDGVQRMIDADSVSLESHLSWIGEPDVGVVGDGRVQVRIGERELTFPPAAEQPLRSIDGSSPVASMPGIDNASRLVVARRLVREGFCLPDNVPSRHN